jgi:hypothetical protein
MIFTISIQKTCSAALIVLLAMVTVSRAAEVQPENLDWMKMEVEEAPKARRVSHEAMIGYSFVADADVRQGNRSLDQTEEQASQFSYVASIPVSKGWQLRAGFGWDRLSFGSAPAVPIPDTLQSTQLVLGADVELSEKWLMRLELQPGIYSDFEDIDSGDFDMPIVLGFSYLANSRLQWVFGLLIGYYNEYPVLPGAGVRWQFADDWTLHFILPKPRLEYQVNQDLDLFVGAEVKGGNYRTGSDFGTAVGNPSLNNAVLSYREIRAGAGLVYQFHPALALEAGGGWMVDRVYDYYRADTRVRGEGAPYAEIAVKARF